MQIGETVILRHDLRKFGKVIELKASQHKEVLVRWQNGLEFWYDKISLKVIKTSIKREVKP